MKYAPHSNHKDPDIPGVGALRGEPVNTSAAPNVVAQMLNTAPGSARRPKFGYYCVAAAAAAVGGALLLPRKSSAMSMHEVARAARLCTSWYEETYRPDKSGKLQLVLENWTAPGKSTCLEFTNGKLDCEKRFDGKLEYGFFPAEKYQRIAPWGMEGFPLSTVESFEEFKLIEVRKEGSLLRYVFDIHQDLLVDPATKLPVERDVYHKDGSILEIHKYFFGNHFDERLFEPDIKPGVPLIDIPAEQAAVNASLSGTPQTEVVGGISVSLYAVIIQDKQSIGAVVVGGSPHPPAAPQHMQIVGIAAPESRNMFDSDPWPGEKKPLIIAGRAAHIERAGWLQRPSIPDRFTLRMPVWKSDSTFAGWAEFEIADAIRAEGIDEVLPNFVEPGDMKTGTAGEAAAKP